MGDAWERQQVFLQWAQPDTACSTDLCQASENISSERLFLAPLARQRSRRNGGVVACVRQSRLKAARCL